MNTIEIVKPMTRLELANFLFISISTFERGLKKHDIILPKGLIYPKDIKRILKAFGYTH